MRKKILLILTVAFCIFVAKSYGQDKSDANAPEITFQSESFDFGNIKQGGNGVHEFVFTNTGKSPLIITNAQGSCGCTVPTWPKEPIKPGEKSTIHVKYDTNRPGPFTKQVTLTSNAKTSTKVLSIKGVVEEVKEQTSPFKNTDNSGIPLERGF